MLCMGQCFGSMATGSAARSSKQARGKLDSFVVALTKKGIKLLALDFDKTLIDIHSGGTWQESLDQLVVHVRPCMRDLIEAASSKGLFVAVVTFHRQGWLIKDLLCKVLPKKVANKVYVQASTLEFLQRQRQMPRTKSSSETDASPLWTSGPTDMNGKEAHIAAVISNIYKDHGLTIKKQEIILLDDDINNVRIASSFGHYAFQVQENVDYKSFESFETMLLL